MKFPRIIHDPAEVDEILKDRAWGMSMPALAPLLGDGVIMATGSHHTALRQSSSSCAGREDCRKVCAGTQGAHATSARSKDASHESEGEAMSWADKYIAELNQDRSVSFRPRGKSMKGALVGWK